MAEFRTVCILCGCTDERACSVGGEPCQWAFVDRAQYVGVCSGCFYAARHTPPFTAAPVPEPGGDVLVLPVRRRGRLSKEA